MTQDVHIIGGGLAGSEAAWQLGKRGVRVRLSEMRGGGDSTAAHQGDGLAELVCSNSFRSDDADSNAVGLLHQEMRALDSLVMRAAEVAKVPAGSALAVDRDVFSGEVTRLLTELGNVEIVRERIDALPCRRPHYCRHRSTDGAIIGTERLGGDRSRQPGFFRRHCPYRLS